LIGACPEREILPARTTARRLAATAANLQSMKSIIRRASARPAAAIMSKKRVWRMWPANGLNATYAAWLTGKPLWAM
jgi:hypothetical protein